MVNCFYRKLMYCPLCNNDVNEFHKRSHLVPEWVYSDCYDDNHKALKIETDKRRIGKAQKGIYASIICKKCEKESQKYDHYASLIMTQRSPLAPQYLAISRKEQSGRIDNTIISFSHWDGINFNLFQKYIFSVILKTHFYLKNDNSYLLIEKHFNNIMSIYNSTNNVDDTSYPIVISKLYSDKDLNNNVILPYRKRLNGHFLIEFSGGGFIYDIYVSSHKKPHYVYSLMLKRDGSILMPHTGIKETGLWKDLKRHINKNEDIISRFY